MIEALKAYIPGWAFALLLMVLSAALFGLASWQATGGDVISVAIAVLGSLIGPGVWSAKGLTGGGEPPATPPAAVVTP